MWRMRSVLVSGSCQFHVGRLPSTASGWWDVGEEQHLWLSKPSWRTATPNCSVRFCAHSSDARLLVSFASCIQVKNSLPVCTSRFNCCPLVQVWWMILLRQRVPFGRSLWVDLDNICTGGAFTLEWVGDLAQLVRLPPGHYCLSWFNSEQQSPPWLPLQAAGCRELLVLQELFVVKQKVAVGRRRRSVERGTSSLTKKQTNIKSGPFCDIGQHLVVKKGNCALHYECKINQ